MRNLVVILLSLFVFVGCSNTARGIKKDVNEGASWVERQTRQFYREMAERSKAAVLKTVEGHTSWGSNPYFPATFISQITF